jgi:hypothetical protein
MLNSFVIEKYEGRDNLENLGIKGRTILKFTSNNGV